MSKEYSVYVGDTYSVETAQAGIATLESGTYTYADWLEPTHLTVTSSGEIGEVRITGNKHPEDGVGLLDLHQSIKIREGVSGPFVFHGVVVKKHVSSSGENEVINFVAYNNADYLLYRICLHGQYRRNYALEQAYFNAGPGDGAEGIMLSQLVLIDAPLVFNPDGAPNMSEQQYFNSDDPNSNTISLFDAPYRNHRNADGDTIRSVPWKLKEAVQYILNLTAASWAIDPASYNDTAMVVFDLKGNPEISNVNLEGKPLGLALRELLEPHNYGFWINPTLTVGGKQQIKFFFRGDGEAVSVTLPVRDETDTSGCNVLSYDLLYDSTAVVNYVTGVGAQKTHTTLAHTNPPGGGVPVMTLVPAWSHDDLVYVVDANNPGRINPFAKQFRKDYAHPDLITKFTVGDTTRTAYGVGRLWMVNLGEVPDKPLQDMTAAMNDGVPHDNSIDPRRFEKPEFYVTASAGGILQQEEVQVEMSFDGGVHWNIVDKSYYRVLSEGMGVVFTEPRLERLGTKFDHQAGVARSTYWQCLYDMLYAAEPVANKLQIRVLAAVKSDAKVIALRPNFGDSVPLATERLFDNQGYLKNIYNAHAYDSLYYVKFPPQQLNQDDSDALMDVVLQQAKQSDRVMVSGKIVVLLDEFNQYKPGQVVTGINNRMTIDPPPTIVRVCYSLVENHVELILDNQRVVSIVRNKPLGDQRTAQQYGASAFVGSPIPEGAGHKVDHLPGVKKDRSFARRYGGGMAEEAGDEGDPAE